MTRLPASEIRRGLGPLGRSTLLTTFGLGTRAVLQAVYLIVLSRSMGPEYYGLFAGSVAAAILLAPLSGWGVATVLTKWVGRDPSTASSLWCTGLLQTVLAGGALLALLYLGLLFLPLGLMDVGPMLLIGVSELVALPVAQLATSVALATRRDVLTAVLISLTPMTRLLIVLVAMGVGCSSSPEHIAVLHSLGSIAGMVAAFALVSRLISAPTWHNRLSARAAAVQGTPYAVGALVGASYQEVDKVLVLQIVGASAAGVYTTAFRVMSVLVVPIAALISAAMPRLFAARARADWRGQLRAVTGVAAAYGLLAAIVAALGAPFLPSVFGEEYAESTETLLALSPWAFTFALHQAGAAALTAANRQRERIFVESLGLIVVVTINFMCLGSVGIKAAVSALLIGEVFMATGCWLALRVFR
jgi:O-antigen/teichoic acid export membrane protein